jgi:hypothetical protein
MVSTNVSIMMSLNIPQLALASALACSFRIGEVFLPSEYRASIQSQRSCAFSGCECL